MVGNEGAGSGHAPASTSPQHTPTLQVHHRNTHQPSSRKHGNNSTDLNANNSNFRAIAHLLTLFDKLMKHMTASSPLASASALITQLAGVKVVSTSSSTRLQNIRGRCDIAEATHLLLRSENSLSMAARAGMLGT